MLDNANIYDEFEKSINPRSYVAIRMIRFRYCIYTYCPKYK